LKVFRKHGNCCALNLCSTDWRHSTAIVSKHENLHITSDGVLCCQLFNFHFYVVLEVYCWEFTKYYKKSWLFIRSIWFKCLLIIQHFKLRIISRPFLRAWVVGTCLLVEPITIYTHALRATFHWGLCDDRFWWDIAFPLQWTSQLWWQFHHSFAGHELIRFVRVVSQYILKQLLLFFHGNIDFFDVQVNLIVPI
jgi:hypothetical protein